MGFRHKLIRWLSLGDPVIMNLEFFHDVARPRNAGEWLIANCEFFTNEQEYGISVAMHHRPACLKLEPIINRDLWINLDKTSWSMHKGYKP